MKHKRKFGKFTGTLLPAIIIIIAYFVLPYINDSKEYAGGARVYYIDVDQGDAALVDINGHFVMIDGGTDSSVDDTISFMSEIGVDKLDCVIATHPHEDHIGGLDDIVNTFTAEKAYLSHGTNTTFAYENLLDSLENTETEVVYAGDEFEIGDAKFEIFAPQNTEYKELNNYSLCVKMTYGEKSFLFTGDAEELSESEMLSEGYDLDSDVLKVAHHGSKTSSSREFLDKVTPEISVISVGRNSYGLPNDETVDKLNKISEVFRTDINGTITVETDGKELYVKSDYN